MWYGNKIRYFQCCVLLPQVLPVQVSLLEGLPCRRAFLFRRTVQYREMLHTKYLLYLDQINNQSLACNKTRRLPAELPVSSVKPHLAY